MIYTEIYYKINISINYNSMMQQYYVLCLIMYSF